MPAPSLVRPLFSRLPLRAWRHGREGLCLPRRRGSLAGLRLGWTSTVVIQTCGPSERAASRPRPAPGPCGPLARLVSATHEPRPGRKASGLRMPESREGHVKTQRSEQPRGVRRTLGLRARTIESRRALGAETGWKQAGSRASYRRACWRTGSEVRRAGVGPDSDIDST